MKLMPITIMTPLRDEKGIIQKWEERSVSFNPRNIESIGFVEEIGKCQVILTSGRAVPVKESINEICSLYEDCTKFGGN